MTCSLSRNIRVGLSTAGVHLASHLCRPILPGTFYSPLRGTAISSPTLVVRLGRCHVLFFLLALTPPRDHHALSTHHFVYNPVVRVRAPPACLEPYPSHAVNSGSTSPHSDSVHRVTSSPAVLATLL